MRAIVTRLIIFVLILVCGFGLYFVVTTAEALPVKQAQEAALSRYGAALIALCAKPSKTIHGSLPATLKLAVINSANNTVFESYNSALPATLQTKDKADVTALLCVSEKQSVFDTDKYGTPQKYTCTRYERDINAYVVDAKTGDTLAYQLIEGPEPPDCPEKTDTNLTKTGEFPPAADVNSWLASRVKGQL